MTTHPATTPAPAHRPSLRIVRDTLRKRALRPAARDRLACTFERLVTEPSHRREPLLTARVRTDRTAIHLAERELLDIASRLRAEPAPSVEGVRAAERLLTDGAGPVYIAADRQALRLAARGVLARL